MIGEKVMEKLRELDEVAYLRYASVHRRFEDVDQFVDEIQRAWSPGQTKRSRNPSCFNRTALNNGRV